MTCVQGFTQNDIGVVLLLLSQLNWVFTSYTQNNITQVKSNSSLVNYDGITKTLRITRPENYSTEAMTKRVKRQSGTGGKYTDAAKMPQVKLMRLFLQMFKNLWAPTYVGGAHPFHHEVPKPVVYLFKDKIVKFFFPEPLKTQTDDEEKKSR